MTERARTTGFDDWYEAVAPRFGERPHVRTWMRSVFDRDGPVADELMHARYEADQLAMTKQTLTVVLDRLGLP